MEREKYNKEREMKRKKGSLNEWGKYHTHRPQHPQRETQSNIRNREKHNKGKEKKEKEKKEIWINNEMNKRQVLPA